VMKKLRSVEYQSLLWPSLEQIQSWRRAKIWRTIAQLSRKISDVHCAIISAQQLRLAKSLISEILSGGIQ
jgi:hypothetical protein